MKELKLSANDLALALDRSSKREAFYLETLRKFMKETTDLGLTGISEAYKDALCIYASNPEDSVDNYLEGSE